MAVRKVNLLQELRYVSHEIGMHEARRLSIEERQWWINEMVKEREAKSEQFEEIRSGKKTVDAR